MSLSPTTELEAVNEILTSIGEAPVNKLGSGLTDAEVAESQLNAVSRKFQANGWAFNIEKAMTLSPNFQGEVELPNNTLSLDEVIGEGNNLVMRGTKLYDRIKHTFTLDRAVICDITVMLPFIELPEPARSYITLKAARIFQDRMVGAADLHGYQREDEERAWFNFLTSELEQADYNIFNNAGIQAKTYRRV